jgi:Na+/proline symporter
LNLSALDLTIVVGYVVATVGLGLYVSRRATRSIDDYFVGGRSLSWWMAGLSMIASAFAIDTPLGITTFVAENGIQGVWFAWTYIIGGAGTFGAFIFAALLRRSRIITAAELIELRYSGRDAAFLRGFKGIYFGVISTCIQMGWVINSVLVVSREALGWDALPTLVVVIGLTMVYTTASGLWGVAVTDFVQFFVGSFGLLALTFYALGSVGGLEGIQAGMLARYGAEAAAQRMQFLPRPSDAFFHTFLVFVTLKWWGNPPGSLTQRILSTRDERHATYATLLFALVHFAINYWPMILVALVSLVTYTELPAASAQQGYARLMVAVLPSGVLGLSLAASVAAFMSTIDTQINMGASYMVNDIYRRFIKPDADKRHYVRASQVSTLIMLALAVTAAFFMESVGEAWRFQALLIAGYGFVTVARWFWWRINAWAEMSSLVGSAAGALLANFVLPFDTYGEKFTFTACISILSWVVVALATRPSEMERLAAFCRAVKPYPALWGPVRERYPDLPWSPHLGRNVALWLVGTAGILGLCFGIGHLLLGSAATGATMLAGAGLALALILRSWRP